MQYLLNSLFSCTQCSLYTFSYFRSTFLILILSQFPLLVFCFSEAGYVSFVLCTLPFLFPLWDSRFCLLFTCKGVSWLKSVVYLIDSIYCCLSAQRLCLTFMSVLSLDLIYPAKSITFLQYSQIILHAWKVGCRVNMRFRDQVSKLFPALLLELLPLKTGHKVPASFWKYR